MFDQVWIRYQCFCFFKLHIFICGFVQKWLAHFLFVRSNGEVYRNTHFSRQKNDVIYHIFNQINVVNRALPSLLGGSLEITLTVPLNQNFTPFQTFNPLPPPSIKLIIIRRIKSINLQINAGECPLLPESCRWQLENPIWRLSSHYPNKMVAVLSLPTRII